MKLIITTILLGLSLVSSPDSQNRETKRVLDAWIKTQNTGTDKAIQDFINTFYAPEVLAKMKNFDAHQKFYRTIIDEFGEVQSFIYKTEESTSHRLKVQVLKKSVPAIPEPEPTEILVIEIDLSPKNPKYISRGLGMGALICYIKR